VVHGQGGLDEVSTLGTTRVSEVREGKMVTYYLDPNEYDMDYTDIDRLRGGTADENAAITLSILKGEKGPRRDIVLLNTAVALMAYGMVKSVPAGLKLAAQVIDSGDAERKLTELVRFTQNYARTGVKVG